MVQKLGEIGGRNKIYLTALVKVLFVCMFLLFLPFQFSNYKFPPNKNHTAPPMYKMFGNLKRKIFELHVKNIL